MNGKGIFTGFEHAWNFLPFLDFLLFEMEFPTFSGQEIKM